MREPELKVITKTYDLVLWSCQHTGRFPRNHRFVLGERIERRLYELLETLLQAKYSRDRQGLLRSQPPTRSESCPTAEARTNAAGQARNAPGR
jgi:hypothetical protein